MVEDYALRKLAKKHRKREGADERGKRVRTKKNKIRRICRGQCYKEPFAVRRPGQTLADVDREVNAQDDDEEATAPKAKRRRKADPKKDSVKQSTSINLLHTSKAQSSNAAPKASAAPLSEALATFPASIQQFMQDQGLTGLTPIQERCPVDNKPKAHKHQSRCCSCHCCIAAVHRIAAAAIAALQKLASVLSRPRCASSG